MMPMSFLGEGSAMPAAVSSLLNLCLYSQIVGVDGPFAEA